MNEGLADWAQTLTGYVDTSIPITDLGYDSHVQCFLGWLGVQTDVNPIPRDGGPENSLNLWGDQNDFEWEILCDYGAAYTLMELLADRFGIGFMGDLHQDAELQGFDSLNALLDAAGSSLDARGIIDQWASAVALDGVLDDGAHLKEAPSRTSRCRRLTRRSTGTRRRPTAPPALRRTAPTTSDCETARERI